jgi:hypothetical protein
MGTISGTGRRKRKRPARTPKLAAGVLDLLATYAGPGPFNPDADPAVVDDWLAYFEARYVDTANPVFVWEVIAQALGHGRPLPAAAIEYLIRVATQMQRMSRLEIPDDALAPAVYRALEFVPTRGVNPFRAITDMSHDLVIAGDVWLQLDRARNSSLRSPTSRKNTPPGVIACRSATRCRAQASR